MLTAGVTLFASVIGAATPRTDSASATVICPENEDPCLESLPAGSELGLTSSSPTLSTSIVTVVCSSSAAALKTTTEGEESMPVEAQLASLSFSECKTTSGTKCEVTTQGFPANGSLVVTTAPNGTLTVTPATAGTPGAKVVCGVFINCTFTTSSAKLAVEGGDPLKAVASAIALDRVGGICPKSASWTATY
jgi:hypothetical protein